MTPIQKKFCDHYLIFNNASKAAVAAGYSEKTSRQKAYQLLCNEEIEKYIEERRQQASEQALVDAAWVQKRFKDISDRCMTAEPVIIMGEPTGEYKFDSSGANKATEMLGKIIGVFEKDNNQNKPETTNIINLGGGVDPNAATK